MKKFASEINRKLPNNSWTKFANYDHSDTLEIHGRTGGHRLRTFILICLLVYTDRTDIGGTVTAAQVSTI